MTAIEKLAAFVAEAGQPSAPLKEQVHLHLIDTTGALIAGTATPEGNSLLRFEAQTTGQGGAADIAAKLMSLCARTRLSEIDDIHVAAMTTPGSIVIPGALAIATPREDHATDRRKASRRRRRTS